MADARINIKIGSEADTKGFMATAEGVLYVDKNIKKLNGALHVTFASLGRMPGVIGEISSAAGSLAESFTRGGIMGLATSVVGNVVNSFARMLEQIKEIKTKAEELQQDFASKARIWKESFRLQAFSDDLKQATSEAQKLQTAFEKAAVYAQKISSAQEATRKARASSAEAALQLQSSKAQAAETDPAKRSLIAAAFDIQAAKLRADSDVKAAQASSEAARQTEKDSQATLAAATKRRNELNRLVDAISNEIAKEDENSSLSFASYKKLQARLEDAQQAYAKATEDQQTAQNNLALARENVNTALAREAQVRSDAERSVLEASDREKQLRKARADALKAEADRQAKQAQKADAERALEAEKAEQERILQERHRVAEALKQQADSVRSQIQRENDAAAELRSNLAQAHAKAEQAWQFYLDKDSLKSQLEREKANAQAEEQFAKDFRRLSSRRSWRTADNLSLEDEAVRRVALAREEEEDAQRHLAAIEENTADLATKLDQLLTLKEGE